MRLISKDYISWDKLYLGQLLENYGSPEMSWISININIRNKISFKRCIGIWKSSWSRDQILYRPKKVILDFITYQLHVYIQTQLTENTGKCLWFPKGWDMSQIGIHMYMTFCQRKRGGWQIIRKLLVYNNYIMI